jgi:hypothetical protein
MPPRMGRLSQEELEERDSVLAKHARGEALTREEADLCDKEKRRRHMLEVRARDAVGVGGGASDSSGSSASSSGSGHVAGVRCLLRACVCSPFLDYFCYRFFRIKFGVRTCGRCALFAASVRMLSIS